MSAVPAAAPAAVAPRRAPQAPFVPTQTTETSSDPTWASVLLRPQRPPRFVEVILCCFLLDPLRPLTRAQWIYGFRVVSLVANAVCLRYIMTTDHAAAHVDVLRLTHPAAAGTAASAAAASAAESPLGLQPNGLGFNLRVATAVLFAAPLTVDAVYVLLGPFDAFVWALWRQIDLCFCWHRYVENMATVPTAVMLAAVVAGLAEQNALAAVWMLAWSAVALTLLTEMWSRPHKYGDDGPYGGFYDMSRWAGDLPPVAAATPSFLLGKALAGQRALEHDVKRKNYVVRMLPTTLASFPYFAAWALILNHLWSTARDDRNARGDADDHNDIFGHLPAFIPTFVVTTLAVHVVAALPMIRRQFLKPSRYWETEIVYLFVGFAWRFVLGYMTYANVLLHDGGASAALAARRMR